MTGWTLGDRIYYARVHAGRRSMAEFGRAVAETQGRAEPFHPATVSDWERNRNVPSLQTLAAIASASGVRVEWLCFRVGQPHQPTYQPQG